MAEGISAGCCAVDLETITDTIILLPAVINLETIRDTIILLPTVMDPAVGLVQSEECQSEEGQPEECQPVVENVSQKRTQNKNATELICQRGSRKEEFGGTGFFREF